MRWRFWRKPDADTEGMDDAARRLEETKARQQEVSEMVAKHEAAQRANGFARDVSAALRGEVGPR